jgi:hypothetical protein
MATIPHATTKPAEPAQRLVAQPAPLPASARRLKEWRSTRRRERLVAAWLRSLSQR